MLFFHSLNGQNVAINNSNAAPDPSAILDINSPNKGILLPRVTLLGIGDAATIPSPATGLMVYNASGFLATGLYCNEGTPVAPLWTKIKSGIDADWSVSGNIVLANHFIGTTNFQSLRFKVNNVFFGALYASNDNIGLGEGALQNITTGIENTGIGALSLKTNSSGSYNTSFGAKTLVANSTGYENVAIGRLSMNSNTIGSQNTAIGSGSMRFNTDGQVNTAVGYESLNSNTHGNGNTALGSGTLFFNTNGGNNVALGANSLRANTNGQYNTASGVSALYKNLTGNNNIAMGVNSLRENTTGYSNIGIGRDALYNNIARNNNVAVGDSSLRNNSFGAGATYEGSYNTAVGSKSLMSNTTGYKNTAVGFQALYSNTIAYRNTAVGNSALRANTFGSHNVAVGDSALVMNVGGNNNTAVGNLSLRKNSGGGFNVAMGHLTATNIINGSYNTAIGGNNMTTNITGNYNTTLGYSANVTNTALSHATAIGAEAGVQCSNCLVLGGTGSASVFVGINQVLPTADLTIKQKNDGQSDNSRGIKLIRGTGTATFWRTYVDTQDNLTFEYNDLDAGNWAWITTNGQFTNGSDQTIKKDIQPLSNSLDAIMRLAPKSYHYIHQASTEPIQYGFIAQEVENIFPDVVMSREDGKKGIAYTELIPIAIKAIQEQQTQIETLQAQNNDLMTRLQQLETLVAGLQAKGN